MNKSEFAAIAKRRARARVNRATLPLVEADIERRVLSDGDGRLYVRLQDGRVRTGSDEELLALLQAVTIDGLPEGARRGAEPVTAEEIARKLERVHETL